MPCSEILPTIFLGLVHSLFLIPEMCIAGESAYVGASGWSQISSLQGVSEQATVSPDWGHAKKEMDNTCFDPI
jgi:hypothetical protein